MGRVEEYLEVTTPVKMLSEMIAVSVCIYYSAYLTNTILLIKYLRKKNIFLSSKKMFVVMLTAHCDQSDGFEVTLHRYLHLRERVKNFKRENI